MTVSETLFGEAPASQPERLRTQLAAVALLVARSDRDVAQDDILLATIFEVLEPGALTAPQIRMSKANMAPRALSRLSRFGFAQIGSTRLRVRTTVPQMPVHWLAQLPEYLRRDLPLAA